MYTTIASLVLRSDALYIAQLAYDEGAVHETADADTLLASDTDVQGRINQAISDATDELDSILQARLDMTLSANQTAVEAKCAWIALYFLYLRRHNIGNEENPHYRQYRDAINWAKEVAKGRLHVGVSPERPAATAYSNTQDSTPVLGDDALAGF